MKVGEEEVTEIKNCIHWTDDATIPMQKVSYQRKKYLLPKTVIFFQNVSVSILCFAVKCNESTELLRGWGVKSSP